MSEENKKLNNSENFKIQDYSKPESFYFDLPLYTEILIIRENIGKYDELLKYDKTLEGYNPLIKERTTFKVTRNIYFPLTSFFGQDDISEQLVLKCLRTDQIFIYFIHYNRKDNIFMKIGQYPSIADIHISQIREYDKVLSKEKLKEFTKAIGLAANGVGIGSFVYLRRIFEDLIEEAHLKAKNISGWDENKYEKSRIKERIELLQNHLPSFLYENRDLYNILSIGVHSLNENDCLLYFDTVKAGIELILDEKLEAFIKEEKYNKAKSKIQKLTTDLSKKK